MTTRSRIAFKNANGKIISSYCHRDGYLEGVGEILATNLNGPEEAMWIASRGGMLMISTYQIVKEPPIPGISSASYDATIEEKYGVWVEVFGASDATPPKTHSDIDSLMDDGEEWMYIYDGQWMRNYRGEGWLPVRAQITESRSASSLRESVSAKVQQIIGQVRKKK